ncbi:MAG: hypothetical protein L0241_02610, partial [Planctomycetia bacterium]|nr:hypothetical protein [Planctomycetia bacterium]
MFRNLRYRVRQSASVMINRRSDRRIVTGSADGTARVWDGKTGITLFELKHTRGVTSVAVSADGARIVTGTWDWVRVWDGKTGGALREWKVGVMSVAVSADGSRVATASAEGARVWDVKTGTALVELKGRFSSVAMSADASRVVTGSFDGLACVWDGNAGTLLVELKGHTQGVRTMFPLGNHRFSSDDGRRNQRPDDIGIPEI